MDYQDGMPLNEIVMAVAENYRKNCFRSVQNKQKTMQQAENRGGKGRGTYN